MRILIAALFVALLGGEAVAQSCGALRAQLAAARSGGPDTAAIARLQRQAAAYGCNASGGFGRHRACAGIEAQMRRARQGGSNPREIRSLKARISRVCNQERQVRRPEPVRETITRRGPGDRIVTVNVDRDANIFSSIFGRREVVRERAPDDAYQGPVERLDLDEFKPDRPSGDGSRSSPTGPIRIGNARTVCVRLCDGFYFPINSRSHYSNFKDELAMCVGRCPGADVSLYAHNRNAPVETMRSTSTGERYVSLPTAFAYRKKLVPSCTCQPQTIARTDNASEALGYLEGDSSAASEAAAAAAAPEPADDGRPARMRAVYDATGEPLEETLRKLRARTEPAADASPEAADEAPVATASALAAPPAQPVDAASVSLRVREVGPQFYSAEDAAAERSRRILRPNLTSTAVSVVPVASSVVLSGDGPEAANEAEAIIRDPAADDDEASTTSLLPRPTEG